MDIAKVYSLFEECIDVYHLKDVIEQPFSTAFRGMEALLYQKCWIDTVQWHCEDEVRNPAIAPEAALAFKRQIDGLNQQRTQLVEQIDDYFLDKYSDVVPIEGATINTESPAWAIDRLSILALKIYHFRQEFERQGLTEVYRQKMHHNLQVLYEQREHLMASIGELLRDIEQGKKLMKVYRQLKMYNDVEMNPVLRKNT